jgi:hypothetical protein
MYRAGFILGVAVWLTGQVFAQDAKPPATEIAPPQAAPIAPRAPDSELRELASMVSYTIELKLVEGTGPFGNGLEKPSSNLVPRQSSVRKSLDEADPPGTLPFPPLPKQVPTASEPALTPPSTGPNSAQKGRKSGAEDVWDSSSDDPRVRVLLAPKLTTLAKQSAVIEVQTAHSFAYLEPLGNDNFHLRRDAKVLGMTVSVEPRPLEKEENSVEVSLEIEMTTLDGREAVEGLELDAGKPIFATRSLKTTAKAKLGVTRIIAIPSGPATQAVLMLRVKRFELPKKD